MCEQKADIPFLPTCSAQLSMSDSSGLSGEERGISVTQKTPPAPKHRGFLCELNPTVRVLGTESSPQLSQSPTEASLCSFSFLRKKAVFTQGYW